MPPHDHINGPGGSSANCGVHSTYTEDGAAPVPTKSSLLLPYSGFQRFLLPHYYPPSLYPDTDRGSLTSPASNAKRNPDATPLRPLDESVEHFSIGSVVPTPVLLVPVRCYDRGPIPK